VAVDIEWTVGPTGRALIEMIRVPWESRWPCGACEADPQLHHPEIADWQLWNNYRRPESMNPDLTLCHRHLMLLLSKLEEVEPSYETAQDLEEAESSEE